MFEKYVVANKLVVFVLVFNSFNFFSQLIKPRCLDGNCKNKSGTYIYSDSSIYVGEFNDRFKSGLGKISYRNKSFYEGQWLNDKRHGRGIYVDSVGNKYEGNWADDKESGKGKYTDKKGNVYEGTWINGELLGSITIQYRNKNFYQGDYNQGLNGKGKFRYADGSVYTGSFIKNKRSGFGEMIYNFGLTYRGNWVSNEVEGIGDFLETKSQLKIASGKWKTEKTKEGDSKFLTDSGYLVCYLANKNLYYGNSLNGTFDGKGHLVFSNGEIYDGSFSNGKFNGNGKYIYKDKSDYSGEWKDNLKNGFGVQINADKSVIEGYWKEDKYIGRDKPIDLAPFIACPESCSSNSENSSWVNAEKRIGNCFNNLKQGEWKDIDENGRVVRIRNYLNGILEGKEITYFRNGKIEELKIYKNGLLNGQYFYYFEDGKVWYKRKYKNGILIDTAYTFDNSENEQYYLQGIDVFNNSHDKYLKTDRVYNEDPSHADLEIYRVNYYPSGNVESEYFIFNGRIVNFYKEYDEQGKLTADLICSSINFARVFHRQKKISGWEIVEERDGIYDVNTKKVVYQNEKKTNEEILIRNKSEKSDSFESDLTFEEKVNYVDGKIKTITSPYYDLKVTYFNENSNDEIIRQELIQSFQMERELGSRNSHFPFELLLMNLGNFKIECNYSIENDNYIIKRYVLASIMVDSIFVNQRLCDVISLSADNELTVKHYYPNGKLKDFCNYVDYNKKYCLKKSDYESFVPNSELICYFDNGKVKISATFDKGEIKGNIIVFDQNGNRKEYTEKDYNNIPKSDHEFLSNIIRNKHNH